LSVFAKPLSFLLVLFCAQAWAHDGHRPDPKLEQVKVFAPIIIYPDKSIDSHRHDTTDRVQTISRETIEKSSAQSLADLVDNQPGVDTQDYCVNCGAKRLTINGLRAEHTSILVDGIPLYSSVTSVYGLDTIPTFAIEEIEVMRGSGSALINPDSIGGTINLFTIHPQKTGGKIRGMLGSQQTQNFEVLYNHVGAKTRWSLGGDFSELNSWDTDDNGVVEAPFRSRKSFFIKQTTALSDKTQWSLRFGHSELQIIGGNDQKWRPSGVTSTQADDFDFVDGDVRKPFVGELSEITDFLDISRQELTSKLVHILNPSNTLEFNFGSSLYRQKSLYMHGFDYDNRNLILYADVRWNHQINPSQSLLVGASARRESLRSDSEVMYIQKNIPRDDFNYLSLAGFVQHEWILDGGWELSSALRLDRLTNHWLEIKKIDETVIAPRVLLKWQPTEHFANYFSYGQGYRLPLSFVESAHGTYSDGFTVDVTDLERSDSWMLSTSYNTENFYITPSLHYTQLRNMAYDEEPAIPHSMPLRFVTSSEKFDIVTYELLAGYKPVPQWLVELGFESFQYEDGYKRLLPTAAIERRWTLKSQADFGKYSWNIVGVWIDNRDLSAYSTYNEHYNVYSGLLGVDAPKRQRSPSYFIWNTSLSRKIKHGEITLGVDNLLNYTQARAGDTPAMWHAHGVHAHFDNRHVWGPNRGAEWYLRLTLDF
jgi:outer membrane receptor for ferrienterochelin and colicins